MPGTISVPKSISAACAVFKIDLKGRFVYIDDETEELFGLTREELFGKSIYEFISGDAHQVLDTVMGHHKRYESFYESLPLTLREADGQFRQLKAVVTLNFISGNPVNYQFILLPSQAAGITPGVNWERCLLEMLETRAGEVDFDRVAEMFGTVGGYSAAECYLCRIDQNPEIAGSYPHQDPGHSAPSYLINLCNSLENKFSFIPEDCALQGGFGSGKSEAVLPLRFYGGQTLLVWLYGPAEYLPPQLRLDDLRLFSQVWNSHFQSIGQISSAGNQFAALGQAGDALKLGIMVVNKDYDTIYRNDCFLRMMNIPEDHIGDDNFRKLYGSLEIFDLQRQPMAFELSPFARALSDNQFTVDCLKINGYEQPFTILAGPITISDDLFYVYCLIPYYDRAAEAYSQNRTGTKLVLSAAHDIRAPLITIEAFAKRLQTNYISGLDHDGRFAVDCIVENSRILQKMIEGLNELSKNWVIREAPEKMYIKKLVAEVVDYLRATYPNINHQVRIPENLPEITAPKRKLVQLFRNILDNAFKYSASSNHPAIRIDYDLINGWHQFSIWDNGPGIEDDYKQKIFAPFFRAPNAISLPGTGMGLTIASDIITSWGGRIWIDNPHQPGTVIRFILPPRIKG